MKKNKHNQVTLTSHKSAQQSKKPTVNHCDKSGQFANVHTQDTPIATFKSRRFGLAICLYKLSAGEEDIGFLFNPNKGIECFDFRMQTFNFRRLNQSQIDSIFNFLPNNPFGRALAGDIVKSIDAYLASHVIRGASSVPR